MHADAQPGVLAGRSMVIVGAGAIGLAAGYYSQRLGAAVTVVDEGQAGQGASLGNAGWIVPSLSSPMPGPGMMRDTAKMLTRKDSPVYIKPRLSPSFLRWFWGFSRACRASTHDAGVEALADLNARTMQLFDELRRDAVDFEMYQKGLLFAFLSRSAAEEELGHLRFLGRHGYDVPPLVLPGERLRKIEPSLSSNVLGGFVLPGERHLDPATFTAGLAKRIVDLGGSLCEQRRVVGFDVADRRVTGVQTTDGTIEADIVLIASGAHSAHVMKPLGLRLPLEGGKGYSFTVSTQSPPVHPLYLGEAKIGCSPLTHGLRIAGTMEMSGLNHDLHQRRIDVMVRGARRYLADPLDEPPTSCWTGLRPVLPDGLPVMDRLDPFQNVFLSTGHGTLGITLAPAAGIAMADYMATSKRPDVLAPFSWSRL